MVKEFIKNWAQIAIDYRKIAGLVMLPQYLLNYIKYKKKSTKSENIKLINTYPCLADFTSHTPFDPHYFYQGAWMARKLIDVQPKLHIDVGSSVSMLSITSALTKTIFVDYRPLRAAISNLFCVSGNILQLPFESNSIESLSCLHVVEHIGLGRYGDPLDPNGSIKAVKELQRVIKKGGRLYLSVPVGIERVCFNAHRVFDPVKMGKMFVEMKIIEFSLVNDKGEYIENIKPDEAKNNKYACGIYEFEKI